MSTDAKPAGDRHGARRLGPAARARACAVAVLGIVLVQSPSAATAATLECDSIRRLSDNYLLDLRVRLVFDAAEHRYRRFEDAGRGWEEVTTLGIYHKGPRERLILAGSPDVVSYIERMSGTYYYIDPTGETLSVWGHCAVSGPPYPQF